MSVKSGELANETGRFHCERCRKAVHVEAGDEIPVCPGCGNTSFGARSREPGRDVTRTR